MPTGPRSECRSTPCSCTRSPLRKKPSSLSSRQLRTPSLVVTESAEESHGCMGVHVTKAGKYGKARAVDSSLLWWQGIHLSIFYVSNKAVVNSDVNGLIVKNCVSQYGLHCTKIKMSFFCPLTTPPRMSNVLVSSLSVTRRSVPFEREEIRKHHDHCRRIKILGYFAETQ